MRAGLIQMTSSDVVSDNIEQACALCNEAVTHGAQILLTPEVTNCLSGSRAQQMDQLTMQDDDPTLAAMQDLAAKFGVWILIGSLALKTDDEDERFANRSFLINSCLLYTSDAADE